MSRKERETIHELQGQWLFVALGSLLAIFFGLAINALFEILKERWSLWGIFLLFGGLGAFLFDAFTYMFDNLAELRKDPNDSIRAFLLRYLKSRLHWTKLFE